uniref:Rho-GAP domain-containing protein n=1 Tax=Anopheles farauti TaxID=69004 RepID=A0A182Q5S1_9DIPT
MAIPASRVLINDLDNKEELYAVLLDELRKSGIKYRKEKNSKASQEKPKCKRIFKTPLHALELTDVLLANGGIVQIPVFVSNACQFILENVDTEGLFRKAGSTKRQAEIRTGLESGIPLGKSHHVIDVANIIKTFFRDLPEALLPCGNVQEALIRCLSGVNGDRVLKLMMTCLLLPPLTLNTLAYFMQFLHTVSMHADRNKMTAENLAIILMPSIMPIADAIQQRFNSHVKVLQLLIEHSQQIGLIPEFILSQLRDETVSVNASMLAANVTDKKKKKRRSGSLTRMFNGFKKMVSAIGSSENLDRSDERCELDPSLSVIAGTPCLSKSAKKRKVTEGIAFSAKKKKEVTSMLPDNHDLLPCTPLAIKEPKKSRLSLGGSKKPSKVVQRLLPTGSIPSIAEGKPMERRWSVVGAPWGRKKQNRTKPLDTLESKDDGGRVKNEDGFDSGRKSMLLAAGGRMSPVVSMPCLVSVDELSTTVDKMSTTELAESKEAQDEADGDFLKIRRCEYEAIKKRMSDIETKISKEFTALVGRDDVLLDNVEDKYRQTLEQTEPIEATCATTDQLAKRLSRELKIRSSGEHKVIRSPSARKIGTIRRRSREAVRLSRHQSWHIGTTGNKAPVTAGGDLSFYPKPAVLKRGRPNTVQSGLKVPPAEAVAPPHTTPPPSAQLTGGNYTDEEKEEKWVNAESYFETHNVTDENASSGMDSTAEFLTPCKVLIEDYFKTPEQTSRRSSLRSATSKQQHTPTPFITRIDINTPIIKTPMLPPVVPPRIKTPARTPKLPPRTPTSFTAHPTLKTHITPLQEAQSGRASIARIRSQNAGMVMAKAKLFDGLVSDQLPVGGGGSGTSGSSKRTPISQQQHRRQSAKFRSATVAMPLTVVTQQSRAVDAANGTAMPRQLQKLRSASAHHSPRKSTPRKQRGVFTKTGGINRREKLRQATNPASKTILSSPRVVRRLQENVQEQLVCQLSPKRAPVEPSPKHATTTPHIRKHLLRNSPRRILAVTPGRDNRMERYQTPLKATPISRFAICAAPGYENSPDRVSHTRAANVR